MTDALKDPLIVLCEETGLTLPIPNEQGFYVLQIDGYELRITALAKGRVVMAGVIAGVAVLAEKRQETREQLLSYCLTLQSARFATQAKREVLTLEQSTDELVLWRSFDPFALSVPTFLAAAESMLNELEFWKNWLSNA